MPNLKMKPCRHCGKNFKPIHTHVTCCSLVCRLLANTVIIPNSCWIWTGSVNPAGYGGFSYGRKFTSAHRAAYQLWNGKILPGFYVLHSCDNRVCVNPVHLFLGMHSDNMRDMAQKGRTRKGEEHANSVLTTKQVLAIRAAFGTHDMIAEAFGIKAAQVGKIRRREAWAHLED